jgi:hypothetical protein
MSTVDSNQHILSGCLFQFKIDIQYSICRIGSLFCVTVYINKILSLVIAQVKLSIF